MPESSPSSPLQDTTLALTQMPRISTSIGNDADCLAWKEVLCQGMIDTKQVGILTLLGYDQLSDIKKFLQVKNVSEKNMSQWQVLVKIWRYETGQTGEPTNLSQIISLLYQLADIHRRLLTQAHPPQTSAVRDDTAQRVVETVQDGPMVPQDDFTFILCGVRLPFPAHVRDAIQRLREEQANPVPAPAPIAEKPLPVPVRILRNDTSTEVQTISVPSLPPGNNGNQKKWKEYQPPIPRRGTIPDQRPKIPWVIPPEVRSRPPAQAEPPKPGVPNTPVAPVEITSEFESLDEALVFLRRQERWGEILRQIQSCKDDLAVLALLTKEEKPALRSILLGVKVSGFIKGANPLKEMARLVLQTESVPVTTESVPSVPAVSVSVVPPVDVPITPPPVVSVVAIPVVATSVPLPVATVPAAPVPAKIVRSDPPVPAPAKALPVAPPAVSIPPAISLVVIDPEPKTPYDRLANTIKKDTKIMKVILDICGHHIEKRYHLFLPAWEVFEKQKTKPGTAAQQTYQKLQQLMRLGKNGWTDIRDFMFDLFDWEYDQNERKLYEIYPWHKRIAESAGLEASYIGLLIEETDRLKFVKDLKQIKINMPVKSKSPESWYGYEEAQVSKVSLYDFLANLITIRKHGEGDFSTLGIHHFKDILQEMKAGIENSDR